MKTEEEWIQESNWINLVHEVFNDFRYRNNNPDYTYEYHIRSPSDYTLLFKEKVYLGLWTHVYRADFHMQPKYAEDRETIIGVLFYYVYVNVGTAPMTDRSSDYYEDPKELIEEFKKNFYWLHIKGYFD